LELDENLAPTDSADPADVGFWEKHYSDGAPPWDQGLPAPPLVRGLEPFIRGVNMLSSGATVLVPGCGFGHEAMYLARCGFCVTAVDFAPAAVDGLRRRVAQAGLELQVIESDFFALPEIHRGAYDMVVEHTCFCAIPPDRRDEYVQVMSGLLRPRGLLLGLFFDVDDTMKNGPPFPTTSEDIHQHFESIFDIVTMEKPHDSFDKRLGREWLACMRLRDSNMITDPLHAGYSNHGATGP
jgi:SAM-dependent methyltransferase